MQWPQWRKELILLICGLTAGVVGAYGPMLSPGFVEIAANLNITVETLGQSVAWTVLAIGLGLFVSNPLAKIVGRRPIYMVAVVIMLACSIWGAAVKNYNSFLGSRIVASLGMAPFETLVQCTIGDMYFVHERATRIAVWNLFLLSGISGGALVAGYIIERQGYQWAFWVCAIFFGVLMLAIFFFVPETAYRRNPVMVVPASSSDEEGAAGEQGGERQGSVRKMKLGHQHEVTEKEGSDQVPAVPQKHSYWRSLRIYTGRYSQAPGWKPFARPVVMLFYPAVFWGFLVYGKHPWLKIQATETSYSQKLGTLITWIVVFSVVNGVIFVQEPYNFTISETGLISLSPFILTIVGELVSGPLNDWICVWLTKKNQGIYEPEFRLPLMFVAMILEIVGFFGFGASVEYKTHWTGPVLCFGFANMALVFASTCVFGYVIDSYREHNEEALVAINARNLLTFGLTYFVNGWLADQGPLRVFSVLGGLFTFVSLLTIPLW